MEDMDASTSSDDAREDEAIYASLKQGIGSRSTFVRSEKEDSSSGEDVEMESDAEDEDLVLPTSFGQRIRRSAMEKQKNKSKREAELQDHVSDPNFAAFEKHTKGIGMKLLSKMGFKGKLGKDEKGISKPIEVKMRPHGAGLGAAAVDVSQKREKGIETRHVETREEVPIEEEADMWKKKNKEKKLRQKSVYKTAEEMLRERAEAAPMKIVDMRGPHVRVIVGRDEMDAKPSFVDDRTPMSELQHNIRLIVSLTESQIQNIDAKIHHEHDTVSILTDDINRTKQVIKDSEREAIALEQLQTKVNQIENFVSEREEAVHLEELEQIYTSVKAEYPLEFHENRIDCIACSHAATPFAAFFAVWMPLQDPTFGISEAKSWKELLSTQSTTDAQPPRRQDENYFSILLEQAVLPKMRSALLNDWQPQEPEAALNLVETWEHLFPPILKTGLLLQCVLPKIQRCIEAWKPTLHDVSIHHWVHPWLIHLGDHMEPICTTTRHKLALAMRAWHPSDPSAQPILKPWIHVWGRRNWEKFVQRSIVPKLAEVLKEELEINPENQDIEPLKWIMAWDGLASSRQLSYLFARYFFPEWLEVLYEWLVSNPDFDEVSRWYLGWKSLFPEDVLANDVIRESFNAALEMMNAAVETSGRKIPRPPKHFPFADADIPIGRTLPGKASQVFPEDLGLKELVQRFAEDNNTVFLPKPGRLHGGLPVYSFGKVSVTLDTSKQIIWAQLGNQWVPLSLDELVKENKRRS